MLYLPAKPELPADQIAQSVGHLRYEDISQDGRLNLLGLPSAMGVVWRGLLGDHALMREGRKRGVVPILSRLVLLGEETTIPIGRPVDLEGAYELAHTVDADGAVNRIMMNLWTDLRGVKGRTYAPPPQGHGERVTAGRIYAEHVCTRPFAAKHERKVLCFEDPELPTVPEREHAWRKPTEVLTMPEGAATHSREITPAMQVTFGLYQTDSNQHVNSLVYPRLFEQAVLGRLAELGKPTAVLSRYCEIAYRKPSFAGESVHIALTTYELGERFGAVGVFLDKPAVGDAEAIGLARPRCFIHMQFAR